MISNNNLFPVKTGNRYGYINSFGDQIINPKYTSANEFENGIAIVEIRKGTFNGINNLGEKIFAFQTSKNEVTINGFNENLCLVIEEDSYDGSEEKYFINTAGDKQLKVDYKVIGDFSEGLASFAYSCVEFGKVVHKWGFINKNGLVEIQPEFYYTGPFNNGLALVKVKDKYGYINKTGRVVIEPLYEEAKDFSEGLAAVKKDGKWGFISQYKGSVKINFSFDKTENFSEGLVAVCIQNKWGYVDKEGKWIIQPQFEDYQKGNYNRNFSCGLAGFIKDHNWGFINKTGEIVISPIYSYVSVFVNDLSKTTIDNEYDYKVSIINTLGQEVWSKTEDKYRDTFDVDYY